MKELKLDIYFYFIDLYMFHKINLTLSTFDDNILRIISHNNLYKFNVQVNIRELWKN